MLETMYYADEVVQPQELGELPKTELRKAEIEMAVTLVENLSDEFDPRKYDDRYRRELLDLIHAKAEGAPLPEPEEPEAEVVDLMEALRASVEATQKSRARKRPRAKKAS
jgi:DNA end-binding protein Ku